MKRIMNAAMALVLMSALGLMFTHDAVAQQKGSGTGKRGTMFVDQNGDGVCDNFGTNAGQKLGNSSQGKGYGPGNGTGNMGQGPKDGTGYGKKSGVCTGTGTGTGVCDGSGPKGSMGRNGNK
jgi:hypothetical protein